MSIFGLTKPEVHSLGIPTLDGVWVVHSAVFQGEGQRASQSEDTAGP